MVGRCPLCRQVAYTPKVGKFSSHLITGYPFVGNYTVGCGKVGCVYYSDVSILQSVTYRNYMSTITSNIITEIATKLNVRDSPPVKDGVPYRIIVFKVSYPEMWVAAMLPEIILVEELFQVVNESYGRFLQGEQTPCGIVFLCSDQAGDLASLASSWYFGPGSSMQSN